ncbi:MAG: hypothetical protein ACQKBY_04910 [Verrucomicrobiales bacterium]
MREVLIITGIIILGVALRSCRRWWGRKLGALTFLVASYLAFFFLFGSHWAGGLAVALWFLVPWLELLLRIRRLRFPVENKLSFQVPPDEEHFPQAVDCIQQIEAEGFEHITDGGWNWAGMKQYFRFFWHPEKRQIAAVCLCEQDHVAFAYLTLTSECEEHRTFRTTNYPFSPSLKCLPSIHWNHIPCQHACFRRLSREHDGFIKRKGLEFSQLRIPDPEEVEEELEQEMRQQIQFNLERGLIQLTDDGHFRYSWRGLFYLWTQIIKDMVRLC